MENRTEILEYERTDHFKQRARQRFGISNGLMAAWLRNIVAHGTFTRTEQDGIYFLDENEIRVVVDVNQRKIVTTYSLHDVFWLTKRASSELTSKELFDKIADNLEKTFDTMLREQNKEINSLIKALAELQNVHAATKRPDYYQEQELKISELERALTSELNNKSELVKISENILRKD